MIALAAAVATLAHAAAPTFDVQVLSATAKNKVVAGAQVIFQKEGQASASGTTDAAGKASVANRFGVDDGSVSMIVRKDGFSPLVVRCPCGGMSYALSEALASADAFRVVLTWGGEPADLDLHAVFPGSHVYFGNEKGADAFLDVDDTDGYGPETITVRKRHDGEKYVFAVHDYSAGQKYGTRAVSEKSRAKVFVYVGSSLVRSYEVPAGRTGALWVVFAVDEHGAFHDVGNVVDVAEYEQVPMYLRQLTERADFGVETVAVASDAEGAVELAGRADEALVGGDAERAVELYRLAVERNPGLGRAWRGLAAAYSKAGRSAESAWASRKAGEVDRAPATLARIRNERIRLEASSTMKNWKQYTFVPANLVDDNLWTSWQPAPGRSGGVGEWVKLTFTDPQDVAALELSNGFRRIDAKFGDLYHMNNRIRTAVLEFSDGTTHPIELADEPAERTVVLPKPVRCAWVKLTVTSVYAGTKWNDLAISELHPIGPIPWWKTAAPP